MYKKLREIDRELHGVHYPKVFYSEIYLLEDGYKQFFSEFPTLCEPQAYVSMYDDNHKTECKEEFKKSKQVFKQYSCKGIGENLGEILDSSSNSLLF